MTLTIGSKGPEVGQVHQLLIEAGERVDNGELAAAFFGPSTKLAVLDFQASHVDAGGYALAQDGVVGPATLAALERPRAPTESFRAAGWAPDGSIDDPEATVCLAAMREIGTQEDPLGSNRGPRVDEYEGPGWLGVPWCALFASWCWAQSPIGSPFGTLASALKIYNWGAAHAALIGQDELAAPGDVAIILRAGGRGHVEIVVATEVRGAPLSLVGGNVANAVRGTVRDRASLASIVRPRRRRSP